MIFIGKAPGRGASAVTVASYELDIRLGPDGDIFQDGSVNEGGNLENARISHANQRLSAELDIPGIDGLANATGAFFWT